jgi:hypothetical protein
MHIEQQPRATLRLGEIAAIEQQAGLGQRRDGQSVPGRDHLVVALRLRSLHACLAQRCTNVLVLPAIRRIGR